VKARQERQIVAGRACRSKSQIASKIIEHNVAADSSQHIDPKNSDMHVENPTTISASMNSAWQAD
jgi:hypothetical protein